MPKILIIVFSSVILFISIVVVIYMVYCHKTHDKLKLKNYKFKYQKLTRDNIEYFSCFNEDSDDAAEDDNTILTISTHI